MAFRHFFIEYKDYHPGLVLTLIGTVFYATGGALGSKVTQSVGPANIGAVRFLAQAVLSLYFFIRNQETILSITWKQWTLIAVSGIIFSVSNVLAFTAMTYIPISDAVTIFNTQSVLVATLGCIWLKEKVGWLDITTIISVIVGVIFVSQPEFLFGGSIQKNSESWKGYMLSLCVCVITSVITCTTRHVKEVGPAAIMVIQGIFGCFFSLIFVAIAPSESHDPASVEETVLFIGCGLSYYVARFLITTSLTFEESTSVSVVSTMEILFSLVYQIFLFGDYPNYFNILGIVLVMSCVITITLKYQIYSFIDSLMKKRRRTINESSSLLVSEKINFDV